MSNGTRVQFDLPEAPMARLMNLKDRTEAASYAEVVKNALKIYETLLDQQGSGHDFILKDKVTGKEYIYRI